VLISSNIADERLTTAHRAKLAYVYVRQSSVNQVRQHQPRPVAVACHELRASDETDHPFRSNPISRFGVFDHPLNGAVAA